MALASACGGAPPVDRDSVFRDIQTDEALLARAWIAATESSGDEHDEAIGLVQEATVRICDSAARIPDDADARARCAQARRYTSEYPIMPPSGHQGSEHD